MIQVSNQNWLWSCFYLHSFDQITKTKYFLCILSTSRQIMDRYICLISLLSVVEKVDFAALM